MNPAINRSRVEKAKSPQKKDIITNAQNVLKLVTGFIGTIALLGIPAVSWQFYRYDIPVQFISSEHIIRASILPAIAIAVIFLFWLLSRRELLNPKHPDIALMWPKLLPIPVLLLSVIMVLIGYLSVLGWIAWGIGWLLVLIFTDLIAVSDIELRRFLLGTSLLSVIFLFGFAWLYLTDKDKFRSLIAQRLSVNSNQMFETSEADDISKDDSTLAKSETNIMPKDQSKFVKGLFSFGIALLSFGFPFISFYLFRSLISKLGFEQLNWVRPQDLIVLIIAWIGLMALLLFFEWVEETQSRNSDWQTIGMFYFHAIFVLFASVIITAYSYWYPHLPSYLGGGELDKVSVWVGLDGYPMELTSKLSNARCRVESDEEVVYCENIFILFMDSKHTIFTDSETFPGESFILKSDNIKAFYSQ